MRTVDIELGGQTYQINPLPIQQSRAWRKKFKAPIQEIVAAFRVVGKVEINDGSQIADFLSIFSDTLLGSTDLLLDMLFEYSPELQADRERIENVAFDEEALTGFVEVLKLAYPFGQLIALFSPNGR
jgi:hypothetical protein